MDRKIRIATIIPVYNAKDYIVESIKSVYNQKLSPNIINKIFIIYNNPTDQTNIELENNFLQNLESEDIKNSFFISNQTEFQGIPQTRNHGLQCVFHDEIQQGIRYDLIANQDADDVWIDENKLQKQVLFLEENKDIDILGTQYIGRYKNIKTKPEDYLQLERKPLYHDECLQWLLNGLNPIVNASVLFKRNVISNIGMYDDFFPSTEDMWFWYRAAFAGLKFANLEDNCLLYNISNNPKYSDSFPKTFSEMFKAILKTRKMK
jgi:glycosyltransferase involved in cell wall biosynthesis